MPTEQEKIDELNACANYLKVDPKHISTTEATYDGGGHFTGIKVVIHIHTGREIGQWIKDHAAKK